MDALKPLEHMSFDGGNVAEGWISWEQLFRKCMEAGELMKKTKATRVAILLHCAGPQALGIHGTFEWENEEYKNDVDTALKKLQTYCEPCKNVVYERYKFWERSRKEGRSRLQIFGGHGLGQRVHA